MICDLAVGMMGRERAVDREWPDWAAIFKAHLQINTSESMRVALCRIRNAVE